MTNNINIIITYVILGILLIFSIISFAIIIDRLLYLSIHKINKNQYKKYLSNIFEFKNFLTTSKTNTIFNELLLSIIKLPIINRLEIKELTESYMNEIYSTYHRRVNFLGIFAKLSTLLGLLGTVTGMIYSFNNIVEKGISTSSVVAGGISQALITTACGLIIAIPTTFFFEYINNKIEQEMLKIEIIINDLVVELIKKSRKV